MAKRELNAKSGDAARKAAINKINAKFKHKVITTADQVPNSFFLRRPSGIMQLDRDTGGGLPAGGMSFVSGPSGAGKSYLLCRYFALQQKIHGPNTRLALAVAEFAPDHFYMRDCGLEIAVPNEMIDERNNTRVKRGLPAFTKDEIKQLKRQVGEFDIIRGANAEEMMSGILELYATKQYQIIGCDSLNAAEPSANTTKELGDNNVRAAMAVLSTQFVSKFSPLTLGLEGANESTLVFISQVRANSAKATAGHMAKYMHDWQSTGAYSMKHGKLVDVCLWPGKKLRDSGKASEVGRQIGYATNYEIIKGKVGTHDGIRGSYEFHYDRKADGIATLFDEGVAAGVITEDDGEFAVVQPETGQVLLEPAKKKELWGRLCDDFDFQQRVRTEILAVANIACRFS